MSRHLGRVEQAMAPPADAEKPGVRQRDRWNVRRRFDRSAPSGEPSSGGRRIDASHARQWTAELYEVPPRVQKAVRQRVANLARGTQNVEVEAVGEHRAAAAEYAVHGSREARADGFHSRREIALARRFDDRVEAIVLYRIMNQPEAASVARYTEAALQLAHEPHAAQRR